MSDDKETKNASEDEDNAKSFLERKVTRRRALSTSGKVVVAAVGAAVVAGAAGYAGGLASAPTKTQTSTTTATSTATQTSTATSTVTNSANDVSLGVGFLTLNPKERAMVEAVAETMIPTDTNGPGAKEAGVIFFIDRQLAGSYGKNGNMYMQGPFVQPNQNGPITVNGITYSKGSAFARIGSGAGYQYGFSLRDYWRNGLLWLEQYSNSVYGGDFETLSSDKQAQALKDLWNNKPTNFTGPTPQEFFSEMHDMVMAGFFADPIYGGNRGKVSWVLTGYNGTNQGNFYAEGYKITDLMVMDHPVRLKPASLADLQGNPALR